jgi:VWA domain-containing protein
MNHSTRWSVITLLGLVGTASGVRTAAGQTTAGTCDDPCDDLGLCEQELGSSDRTDFSINYTTSGGDAIASTTAVMVRDAALNSDNLFATIKSGVPGFLPPWASPLDDGFRFDINIEGSSGGGTGSCRIRLGPSILESSGSPFDNMILSFTSHELFHSTQYRYACGFGSCGTVSGFGKWMSEATPVTMEDRLYVALDQSIGDDAFYAEISTTSSSQPSPLLIPDNSMFVQSYAAALFWSYCCEQLGTVKDEPQSGADFLRDFFEILEVDGATFDAATMLNQAIGNAGGRSLNNMYHLYSIANYAKDLNQSGIGDPVEFSYVDESQYGEAPYPSVPRRALASTDTQTASATDEYSMTYEMATFPVDTVACEAIGIVAQSDEILGWGGVASDLSGNALDLQYAQDIDFALTYIGGTDTSFPIADLTVVGTRLDAPGGYEVTTDRGPVTLTVDSPSTTIPASPGPATDPGRFIIKLIADGPAGLLPAGFGPRSVLGLTSDLFEVEVDGLPANVYTAEYVGGQYWLVVSAPAVSADGTYDLSLSLCGGSAVTVADAVLYEPTQAAHMLTLDISGSMNAPSTGTTKLEAAQNAASLYVDAVGDDDLIGLVVFSGDDDDPTCDNDAQRLTVLDLVSDSFRTTIRNLIMSQTASGYTSIGDAMLTGTTEMRRVIGPTVDWPKRIVLLSDGKENESLFWDTPSSCTPSFARDEVVDYASVHAIAFTEESDQDLIQQMATETGGSWEFVPLSGTGSLRAGPVSLSNRLADSYLTILSDTRQLSRLDSTTGETVIGTQNAVIHIDDPDVRSAVFTINFAEMPASPHNSRLIDPAGNLVTPGPGVSRTARPTHAVWRLDGPLMTGNYRIRFDSTDATPIEYIAAGLGQSRQGVRVDAALSQMRTGGLLGTVDTSYELGVPVRITAMITDGDGPIFGANVTAVVGTPEGATMCGSTRLNDRGRFGDRFARDGAYSNRVTQLTVGGGQGEFNDPQGNDVMPIGGTYIVTIRAAGTTNQGQPFVRTVRKFFQVENSPDDDQDGLPTPWEIANGTDPGNDLDAGLDIDGDGLSALEEFMNGTRPRDADTDNDGEIDGSEVTAGRCPLDPSDGAVAAPLDNEVFIDGGCIDITGLLIPNTNLLRLPWRPGWEQLRIFRGQDGGPRTLIATILESDRVDGFWRDLGLDPAIVYNYQVQGIGLAGNASSRRSAVFSGQPIPPDTCQADLNGDGILDFFDVQEFLNLFSNDDPASDWNNDGLFDFFDIQGFLNDFSIGCG